MESMPMGDPSADKKQEEAEWAEMRRKAEEAFKKEKELPSVQVDASLEPIEIDLSELEEVSKEEVAAMEKAEMEKKKRSSRKAGEASHKAEKALPSMIVDESLSPSKMRKPAEPLTPPTEKGDEHWDPSAVAAEKAAHEQGKLDAIDTALDEDAKESAAAAAKAKTLKFPLPKGMKLPKSPKEKPFTPVVMEAMASGTDKDTAESLTKNIIEEHASEVQGILNARAGANKEIREANLTANVTDTAEEYMDMKRADVRSNENESTQRAMNEEAAELSNLERIRPYERPMSERKIFKKEEEQLAKEGELYVARAAAKERDEISLQAAINEVAAAGGKVGEFVNAQLAKQEKSIQEKFGIDPETLDKIAAGTLGRWEKMKLEARKLVNKELREAIEKYVKESTSGTDAVLRRAEEAQGPEYYAGKVNRNIVRGPSTSGIAPGSGPFGGAPK